jgi:hypothetical protein
MSTRYNVTLLHIITVFKDIFGHLDGIMRALAMQDAQLMNDFYCAVKCACEKLSIYHNEVTAMTGVLLKAIYILDPFWMI